VAGDEGADFVQGSVTELCRNVANRNHWEKDTSGSFADEVLDGGRNSVDEVLKKAHRILQRGSLS
jgi:hypothetical protein